MATRATEQSSTRSRGATGASPTSMQGTPQRRDVGLGDEIRQIVRNKTYEQLDAQKDRATDNLGALAGAVRGMTQQLRDGGQSGMADYVTRAADTIERWSGALREHDLDDGMREIQSFARRKPAVFLGVAFGVGVLAARFLKSSSEVGSQIASGGQDLGQGPQPWHSSTAATTSDRPAVAHDMPAKSRRRSASAEEL